MEFRIRAGTKVCEFLQSTAGVCILAGPLGSGKTDALCMKTMRIAQEQVPSPIDGIRRSRFAFVRNSTPDLRRTTIRSWQECFPSDIYGVVKIGAPMHHNFRYKWPGGDVDVEVDFIGLDKVEDIRKFRSTQYTRIMFDELEFIIKELFDEARTRLRYPAMRHGGPTYPGVDAATNAPPEDHWLPIMLGWVELPPGLSDEELRSLKWPEEWKAFIQPPALLEQFDRHGVLTGYKVNPKAENLENLKKDYYTNMLPAMRKDAIDSRLMVRTVLVVDGSPVWPMFRRDFHVAQQALYPVPGHEVMVSLDFGRVYPAALFAQEIGDRIYIQGEILGFNEPATSFAPRVKRYLEKVYPGFTFRVVGDPKGADRGQQTDASSYDIFRSFGMPVTAAPVAQNDISIRTEAVAYALNDNPAGVPRIVISPTCRTLIVGMAGRYCLVREEDGELRPKKDKYSNLADCIQYLMLSLGEGRRMINLAPLGDLRPIQTRMRTKHSMRRVS
jgi:hypothetical protein